MANKVSKIGKPNTIAGTTRAIIAAVFTAPITEIAANVYPNNIDPVSPMNIFAGLKLYRRKPTVAPAKARERQARSV